MNPGLWHSVVVPLYNEEANVRELAGRLVPVLEQTGKSFVWNFNTIHAGNFPLADIAPPDVLAGQAVQAYVWDVPSTDTQP